MISSEMLISLRPSSACLASSEPLSAGPDVRQELDVPEEVCPQAGAGCFGSSLQSSNHVASSFLQPMHRFEWWCHVWISGPDFASSCLARSLRFRSENACSVAFVRTCCENDVSHKLSSFHVAPLINKRTRGSTRNFTWSLHGPHGKKNKQEVWLAARLMPDLCRTNRLLPNPSHDSEQSIVTDRICPPGPT